ncbi:MAG: hypothetical protein RLZZ319_355 [Actinomycetota bacterium]|jgi:DNA helicase-2/ATP-dependent DNA helicase PcrA
MSDFTPSDLKDLLGLKFGPNEQQAGVIDLSREGVHLVLAGAGSGKTETMSLRALWLIATAGVSPNEVLGLTFTRKAAGELQERFRIRIAQMRNASEAFAARGVSLAHLGDDPLGLAIPTVSTYNSFASQIFQEHAARIGWDSDSPVVTPATAYAIAREFVVTNAPASLAALDVSVDDLTAAIIRLASELQEFNVQSDELVLAHAADMAALVADPSFAPSNEDHRKLLARLTRVAALEQLLPLARGLISEKKKRGVVEYSDQVVFARQILEADPTILEEYRRRYRVVILDEYQDTSFAQTQLFARLFAAERVTAVGDPNQSIYGWRGASPGNVALFPRHFNAPAGGDDHHTLSVTQRNGHQILAAANVLLNNQTPKLALDVGRLVASPTASDHPIEGTFAPSTSIEAERLATWFRGIINEDKELIDKGEKDRPSTMAMLLRSRTNLRYFTDAFDRDNIPYRLIGVSGILTNPFIADLYCALSVLADPNAGKRLIRLLGGVRWQVSLGDLWSLQAHARNVASSYLTDEHKKKFGDSLVADEAASLVDALDSLRYTDRAKVEGDRVEFTDEGWDQLRTAAEFFHELRQNVDLSIADIVQVTATKLGLDIEGRASMFHQPQAYREAFDDLVHSYLAIPATHSLRGFVEWVEEVEAKERITARSEEPEPGVVQVITIHSSKGLEWDAVAIPRCSRKNNNPSGKADFVETRSDVNGDAAELGWVQLGALPNHIRNEDNSDLPTFDWSNHGGDITVLLTAYNNYIEAIKARLLLPEERRVMYVAVTRARHRLWLSGSWYDGVASTSKVPSDYLTELRTATLLEGLTFDDCPTANPDTDGKPIVWPTVDPLGTRSHRDRYERAEALIVSSTDPVHPDDLRAIEHLLAHESVGVAQIPIRIPASRYAEWAMDVAAVREGNRRPVPSRPYRAARLGTEVHLWIERGHYDDDFVDGYREADESVETDEQMEMLKANYLASRWAGLTPLHREIEILLPQGNHIVVCKIDAVFEVDGRLVVVDWKTGKAPKTEDEKDQKVMQLVLYRRALAALYGRDVADVDAVLYYIADDWEWAIERERLDKLDAHPPID